MDKLWGIFHEIFKEICLWFIKSTLYDYQFLEPSCWWANIVWSVSVYDDSLYWISHSYTGPVALWTATGISWWWLAIQAVWVMRQESRWQPGQNRVVNTNGLWPPQAHLDGLVQERRNSIASAMELCLSCTNPSIWWFWNQWLAYWTICTWSMIHCIPSHLW